MFLVAVDVHSKWVELIPTYDATATTNEDILMAIFTRYGIPELLVSDNTPTFTSDEFKRFFTGNGIRHKNALYHPATN